MDDDKRRDSPRIKADVVVDYTGTEVLLYHHVENISLGGLCIQAPSVEPVGINVSLTLNFADLNVTIDIEGEVVWANEDPPRDMGIRFIGLNEENKDIIRQYIDLRSQRQNPDPS